MLLFYDGESRLEQLQPIPHDNLIGIAGEAHGVELLQKTQVIVFFGVLATLLLVVIARRLVGAPPRMRRILAPLLVAAVAIALRAVFECVFEFVDRPFASRLPLLVAGRRRDRAAARAASPACCARASRAAPSATS